MRARRRRSRGWLVAAAVLLAPGGIQARGPQDEAYRAPPSERRRDPYQGVTPGAIGSGSAARARQVPKRAVLWTGFQPREDGSARIFVQVSGPIEYSQRVEGDTLRVTISHVRFAHRNAQRRLDTRFFATAIAEIRHRRVTARKVRTPGSPREASVELTIFFKSRDDVGRAAADVASDAGGIHYLFLDFPSPTRGGSSRGDEEGLPPDMADELAPEELE